MRLTTSTARGSWIGHWRRFTPTAAASLVIGILDDKRRFPAYLKSGSSYPPVYPYMARGQTDPKLAAEMYQEANLYLSAGIPVPKRLNMESGRLLEEVRDQEYILITGSFHDSD